MEVKVLLLCWYLLCLLNGIVCYRDIRITKHAVNQTINSPYSENLPRPIDPHSTYTSSTIHIKIPHTVKKSPASQSE